MSDIILFIQDNYMIVTGISVLLLLSLIGYLAQNISSRDVTIKPKVDNTTEEEKSIMNIEN